MLFIVGAIIVLGSVIGGYLIAGGHLGVLFQPNEYIIIGGAALGSMVIGNTKAVLTGLGKNFGKLLKGSKYNKAAFLELLGALYSTFKLAKVKGDLALESHVEKPHESPLFGKFPIFVHDHHAVPFFCDYLRLLTLGASTAHEIEAVMDAELDTHHQELHAISGALQTVADAMPALGIVAAVLGVIHTMGSITEPPEVLGHLIGGALVGTFMGVLISYGFLAPMSASMQKTFDAESKYLLCIKTGLIGHMQGYAPQVSIEFARKVLTSDVRPTFQEVEQMVQNIPSD